MNVYGWLGKKLHEVGGRIFITDLDGTFRLSNKNPQPWDVEAGLALRALIERRAVYGEMSGRTTSLMLSSDALRASRRRGLSIVPPRWGTREDGRHCWVAIEQDPAFAGTLDADLHFGWGAQILARQEDGTYASDVQYRDALDAHLFRARAMRLLARIDREGEIRASLAPIEFWSNWKEGKTNVPPLPGRLQLHFRDPGGRDKKERCKEALAVAARTDPFAQSLRVEDDTDPRGERDILYLFPKNGGKEFALDHILERLVGAGAGLAPPDLRVVIAGDRMSDFNAACNLHTGAQVVFLLVGVCVEEQLWGPVVDPVYRQKLMDWNRYARPADKPGYFHYQRPGLPPRTIVQCEVAFPGRRGPEAMLDFFLSEYGCTWFFS